MTNWRLVELDIFGILSNFLPIVGFLVAGRRDANHGVGSVAALAQVGAFPKGTYVRQWLCRRKIRMISSAREGWKKRPIMSTIDEVRAAEKKVQLVLEMLKIPNAEEPESLRLELQQATDEYAKAIRELE